MNGVHEVVTERESDLCIVQGIPYYYCQYDYTYCLDHRANDSLPA